MKALVVYESMFDNTRQVAEAIAAGLGESVDVETAEVSQTPRDLGSDVDLIVAGGPTHAFSMSRTTTRSDAVSQGATEGESEFGLREWLAGLPSGHHAREDRDLRHQDRHHESPAGISREGGGEGCPPPRV